MKIAAWNVNGIRAASKKPYFFDYLNGPDSPDIIGFQEIKALPEQLTDELLYPENYYTYWNPAEKKGYAGTALWSKIKPLNVWYQFEIKDFDHEYHNTEGRVTIAEFDTFLFVTAYFPNGGRNESQFEFKFEFYKHLFAHIQKLSEKTGKPAIVNGDYNIVHKEIDIARPKENQNSIGFTIAERRLLDWVTDELGFIDTFREFDSSGENYTWWHYISNARARNVGWRIDYTMIDPRLREKLQGARILDHVMGSDHCPVEIELTCEEDSQLGEKVVHKKPGDEVQSLF
ncbi:exodeoxyribonuclease III [Candidatus Peregrinibacteria bacterium]|jgi:exodeoxyribonuclease III|nr:exodeoxyribonuclease III [Candidatus Peregrinibacteria bacterium]